MYMRLGNFCQFMNHLPKSRVKWGRADWVFNDIRFLYIYDVVYTVTRV